MDQRKDLLKTFLCQEASAIKRLGTKNLNFFQWLSIIRKLMVVMALPDWTSSSEVRAWAINVVHALKTIAALTETKLDDDAVIWLANIVDDTEVWSQLYELFRSVILGGAVPDAAAVRGVAEDAEIDPFLLIQILALVLEAWKWWRSR
jgi:hypothetical protein